MITFLTIGLAVIAIPIAYLYLLALGALRRSVPLPRDQTGYRFAIAIPAHNEGAVIGRTIARLRSLDYPADRFDVYIVADHCTDDTASSARQAGAVCFERTTGLRGSKGAALGWLFERIWETGIAYNAVVVFDADTRVDKGFLRAMAVRLFQGDQVIQGQHRISNPDDGWFPALTWAMFLVDNRFQNLGRSNLGWSAKNMGDSICFRADVLQRLGWGEGLTEDYEFRQRLLLAGIKIRYEPAAIGYGEAPANLVVAQRQRARWLRGTTDAGRRYVWPLLREGLRRHDLALLDGAAQVILPSYSTLTLLCLLGTVLQLLGPGRHNVTLNVLWITSLVVLFIYPLLGLALERAPARAYLAIMAGPVFMLWRTWLAVRVRLSRRAVPWIRTPHGDTAQRLL